MCEVVRTYSGDHMPFLFELLDSDEDVENVTFHSNHEPKDMNIYIDTLYARWAYKVRFS
jgi:hypothetical protein